ncbi:acyl carrier protein [Bordetella genomosp. 13]|uniref:acyl carrier protein n=1 Tax=Bordetella genomosp. 13 TaxID=463040 RepID=UPI0011A27073|nr:acyl carrier protein [Bordetella genomosp. 13]
MTEVLQQGQEARIIEWCADYVGRALNIDPARVGPDEELDSFGLDSAVLTSMLIEMEEWLGVDIPPSVLFSQSTLRGVAGEVAGRLA